MKALYPFLSLLLSLLAPVATGQTIPVVPDDVPGRLALTRGVVLSTNPGNGTDPAERSRWLTQGVYWQRIGADSVAVPLVLDPKVPHVNPVATLLSEGRALRAENAALRAQLMEAQAEILRLAPPPPAPSVHYYQRFADGRLVCRDRSTGRLAATALCVAAGAIPPP